MYSFLARLETISQPWPRSMKAELQRYMNRFYRAQGNNNSPDNVDLLRPYWLFLPEWLAASLNKRRTGRISKNILNDILWAQFCVFLSIRIKDDYFDSQGVSAPFLFAADAFLGEANAILHNRLGHRKYFWKFYLGCIDETVQAIWEVDILQRKRSASLKSLRVAYARVAAIFKVGVAAVCYLADRTGELQAVIDAADSLAVAGQLLDDFRDINEDLAQGRLNYAVRFIIGAQNLTDVKPDDAAGYAAMRLLSSNRAPRLFSEIRRHVRSAQKALAPLVLPQANPYFEQYENAISTTIQALKQKRATATANC